MGKPTQFLAKYIAAYAPYGLKLIDIRDNHEFELMGLYYDSFSVYSQSEPTRTIYFNHNHYPDIKLILRPLSDILNPEFRQLAHDLGANIDYEAAVYDIERGWTKQHLYEKLLENHFDTRGLIDAGLAVDINTLPLC